jgi:diacylglycerol kinase (ATP)
MHSSDRILLIVNPAAGRRRTEYVPDRLLSILRSYCSDIELFCTAKRGDAETASRQAVQNGIRRIVVAGGDGSINEVVTGLLGSQIQLGIIPYGTTNVLAYELGLPEDTKSACRLAAQGQPRSIDVGIANGHPFILAAGVGFDAELIKNVSQSLKRRVGKAAYWTAGLRQLLRAQPQDYNLTIDGEESSHSLYAALICNTSHYAGRYRLSPDASIDDGLLDLYLIHNHGRLALVYSLLSVWRGQAQLCPHIQRISVKNVECKTAFPIAVELDGDYFCTTPLSISIAENALQVIAG